VRTYLRDELVRFLKGVDSALARATDIVIIGGAAASVHYKFSGGTRDIDTWTNVDEEKLKIFVPEKHDLALMKVLRGDEHDLEAIEGIHRLSPLDADILVQRYVAEMGAVVGEPSRIRGNFLSMIERLFPAQASAIAKQVPRR